MTEEDRIRLTIDAADEERRIEEAYCMECGAKLVTKGNITFCPSDTYTLNDSYT